MRASVDLARLVEFAEIVLSTLSGALGGRSQLAGSGAKLRLENAGIVHSDRQAAAKLGKGLLTNANCEAGDVFRLLPMVVEGFVEGAPHDGDGLVEKKAAGGDSPIGGGSRRIGRRGRRERLFRKSITRSRLRKGSRF